MLFSKNLFSPIFSSFDSILSTIDTYCTTIVLSTIVEKVYNQQQLLKSWMTIKKTEISTQPEFLKPEYLCVNRGIVLILSRRIS